MAVAAKYKGDGSEYLNGIPARDLEDDELEAMTVEQKATIAKSPLYDVRGAASKDIATAEKQIDREQAAEAKAAGAPAPAKAEGGKK